MKKVSVLLSILCLFIIIIKCTQKQTIKKDIPEIYKGESIPDGVKPGIDVLLEKKRHILKNLRVGLITNQSGITKDLISTVDALFYDKSINLICLFSPEHGIRGNIKAGESVKVYTDGKTGLPVYSLYGAKKEPTKEAMEQIDALIFDIQDVGVRIYTYIYTMSYGMQAAAKYNKKFVVLDRPNPLGGIKVGGNVLDTGFRSFIGRYPIAFRHGMTIGELAYMFNKEFNINCDLTVIPMDGWKRNMYFEDTRLHWIPPSPHIPNAQTPVFYAATGIIGELGTISEGIGTTTPFEVVGAPWIDPFKLANALNRKNIPGVYFHPLYFRPFYHTFTQKECGGIKLFIKDKNAFCPFESGIIIIDTINKLYPGKDILSGSTRLFTLAAGTDKIKHSLKKGTNADRIISSYQNSLNSFKEMRKQYLIYK